MKSPQLIRKQYVKHLLNVYSMCQPYIEHFGLILSSISKSQEIQKWAGGREGVKQSDISILLDVFPGLKLYEELVEDMIRHQQQSTGYIEKYTLSSGFK